MSHKYVLIKFKSIKILVDERFDMQSLLDNLCNIEKLNITVSNFFRDIMNASRCDQELIKKEQRKIIDAVGYEIIGQPFDNRDAELYALDKCLTYSELELELELDEQDEQENQ